MRLVLLGPPGAGKGTQAVRLAERLNVPHIATGDLFRAHTSEQTELGQTASQHIDAGELVPDEVTVDMVRERLTQDDAARGFILDGFPRTVSQATRLDELLASWGTRLDAVIALEAPEDELVHRLLDRGRDDDTEDVIRRRQQVYREETAPLLEHYHDQLVTVEAVGEIEEITKRILDAISNR